MSQAVLEIEGMWCGGCARALQRHLTKIKGVQSATVHLESSSLHLDWDEAVVDQAKIFKSSKELGYQLHALDWSGTGASTLEAQMRSTEKKLAISIFFAMWSMLFSAPTYIFTDLEPEAGLRLGWAALGLSAPVLFYGGSRFLLMAWRWLKVGVIGSDLLVSFGALGAWMLSLQQLILHESQIYTDGTTMLIIFLLTGRLLELQARYRGEKSWKSMLAQAPDRATRSNGERVRVNQLIVGDQVTVQQGEVICVDAVVIHGNCSLDCSLLTGESQAIDCHPGDLVYAGVKIVEGTMILRTQHGIGQRRLDQLAQGMRSALAQRGSLSGLSERAAQIFSWILAISAGVCLLSGYPERAVTLAVVACPCALSIAVPLVVAVTLQRATSEGIHFRDGATLERLASIDTFLFDKTGTLTEGRPELTDIVLHDLQTTTSQARRWAAEMAFGSVHPLAGALREGLHASSEGTTTSFPGLGLKWEWQGETRWLGNAKLLAEQNIAVPEAHEYGTRCYLARNGQLQATFFFKDRIQEQTSELLVSLDQQGYCLGLLSGDHKSAVTEFLASVPDVWKVASGGLSPEDKAEIVAEFGPQVAIVGDGINDALALSRAAVGIAVGSSGGVAFEASGLVLSNIGKIHKALQIAKEARSKMLSCLVWATLYNLILITLAYLGQVGPGLAALAMGLSSISVVLRALY